jgi:CMD domain protein
MTDHTIHAQEEAPDILDELVGVIPGTALDGLRRRRPQTRAQLQNSFDALFAPVEDAAFTGEERALIAAFATALAGDDDVAEFYARRAVAADADRAAVVLAEARRSATEGPYGVYVESGLADESTDGPRYAPDVAVQVAVGERLSVALAHTHLLVFRPREASAAALERLRGAGWSVDGIVTLSQLVAFLAFQQRVAAGLRVLAEEVPA